MPLENAELTTAIEQARAEHAAPRQRKRKRKDAGLWGFTPKNKKTRGVRFLAAPKPQPVDATTTDPAKAKTYPYRQSASGYLQKNPVVAKKFRVVRLDPAAGKADPQ